MIENEEVQDFMLIFLQNKLVSNIKKIPIRIRRAYLFESMSNVVPAFYIS